MFRLLGELYQHCTAQWIAQLPATSPRIMISAKILGIVRNVLIYGIANSGENGDAQAFFDIATGHLHEFYPLCKSFEITDT